MSLYLLKIIGLFLLIPSLSWGWTYDDAKKMMIENNPELQVQEINTEVDILDLSIAKSKLLPFLQLRGGSDRFLQQDATTGYRSFIGTRLSMPVYAGGSLRLRKKLAQQNVDMNVIAAKQLRNEKVKALQMAFAQALYAKRYLEVAQGIESRSMENLRLVELKYKSGMEYNWVLLSTKATLENSRLDVLKARVAQKNAMMELERLVDTILPITSLEKIEETGFYPIPLEIEKIDERLLQTHPSYVQETMQYEQSAFNYQISRALRRPSIHFRTDFALIDTEDRPVIPFWSAGIALTMPLVAFGQYKNQQKIADYKQNKQKIQQEQELRDLKIALRKRLNKYQIERQLLVIADLDLEAAQDRCKVVNEQYQNGLANFDAWDRAQKKLSQVQKQMLVRKKEWMKAHVELVYSMGGEK